MKKYSLALLLAITSLGISAEDRRLENNGNLILENIPPIPMSIKEELSKFQNVRSAAFRGFSNTEDGVFISTRFGNVSQLHYVGSPGAARTQITYLNIRISKPKQD